VQEFCLPAQQSRSPFLLTAVVFLHTMSFKIHGFVTADIPFVHTNIHGRVIDALQ